MTELYTHVADCCGLNAFVMLPRDKRDFIRMIKDEVIDTYQEAGYNDHGLMRGAFVMATTSSAQKPQEAYLKELGFRNVGKQKNTNSGNYVTVWLMSRAKFNRTIMGKKG